MAALVVAATGVSRCIDQTFGEPRAAGLELLNISMMSLRSGTSNFLTKRTEAFASPAQRPVPGIEAGSISLMCSPRTIREDAGDAIGVGCLEVGSASNR